MPAVLPGIVGVTAIIYTASSSELAVKGKIPWLSTLGFLFPEHCYFFIFISLDNSAENLHLSGRFAFLFGMLLASCPYFSLLLCTLERWEGRCQNGLISSKGQLREMVGLQA